MYYTIISIEIMSEGVRNGREVGESYRSRMIITRSMGWRKGLHNEKALSAGQYLLNESAG